MKLRLPGLGRFESYVDPYNEYPEVNADVDNTIARIAGYDENNQLFRFIRATDSGRLKVYSGNLEPIVWFRGRSTTWGAGFPVVIVPANTKQIALPCELLYFSVMCTAAASGVYLMANPAELLRLDMGANVFYSFDLVSIPIAITLQPGYGVSIATATAAPLTMSYNACLGGKLS